jgi:hypothetical protein
MAKYILLPLILCFLPFHGAYGFDTAGLRPLAPNGVFSAFSAQTLGKGRVSFSLGAEVSREPDYIRATLGMSYAISDNQDLILNFPYVDGEESGGMEDAALGFRHRFFDEGRYGPSLAYIITATIPSGRDDFTTEGSIGAGLIISKRVGPVYGHLNLLYSMPGTSRLKNEISMIAGIDFSASHNSRILAEFYIRKGYFSDELDRTEIRGGYRFITGKDIYTTIGIGTDIKRRVPEFRAMLSVTIILPGTKKEIKKIYEE